MEQPLNPSSSSAAPAVQSFSPAVKTSYPAAAPLLPHRLVSPLPLLVNNPSSTFTTLPSCSLHLMQLLSLLPQASSPSLTLIKSSPSN